MCSNKLVLTLALTGAFIAGLAASPLLQHIVGDAHAEAPSLSPVMIDLAALAHADLSATTNPPLPKDDTIFVD
jgi:hypothetical protein